MRFTTPLLGTSEDACAPPSTTSCVDWHCQEKAARRCTGPSAFYRRIVVRHRLILVGWPEGIIFQNLSSVRGGIDTLRTLFGLWNAGVLHFERIEHEHLVVLNERSAAPGKFIEALPWYRSDLCKHRYRWVTNPLDLPRRRKATGVKTPWYVSDEIEEWAGRDLRAQEVREVEDIEQFEESECTVEEIDEIEEFDD
ncbi:hypothetical protein A0H81_10436 [Grifola frondosa]|uniref:Uncharacterized protein n=1 Tax=Grifola frondosa TaxID=5627 RepID=A0A1C7LZ27_GRIFR|nr:hypothetical protein A0H81_10436 [Grifola frondosa]